MSNFKSKLITRFFFLCLLFWVVQVKADIRLGTGLSAVTEGRYHPLIYGSIEGSSWAFSGHSLGYANKFGFHSAYQANFFRLFKKVDFLWAPVNIGVGWGLAYYELGFKSTVDGQTNNRSNFSSGPAIRVFWSIMGPIFLGIEAMYGIRGFGLIGLSTQEQTQLIFGIRI